MNLKNNRGYSLIELMLVVTILGFITSILTPQFDLVLQKASQAKAKGNISELRSAIALYYTDKDGEWPLAGWGEGALHQAAGFSLTGEITPRYAEHVPVPHLDDKLTGFNGFLTLKYDDEAARLMRMWPPRDVVIQWGSADYLPLVNSPYVYDNRDGSIFYSNGNYDAKGNYFFSW